MTILNIQRRNTGNELEAEAANELGVGKKSRAWNWSGGNEGGPQRGCGSAGVGSVPHGSVSSSWEIWVTLQGCSWHFQGSLQGLAVLKILFSSWFSSFSEVVGMNYGRSLPSSFFLPGFSQIPHSDNDIIDFSLLVLPMVMQPGIWFSCCLFKRWF